MSVHDFAAATAGKQPIPGGGSVAGVVGALATALGEMALAFTRGKKKFAAHEADYAGIAARLARARAAFEQLIADDAEAYLMFQQAPAQDPQAKQLAVAAAIDVPREMAALAVAVLGEMHSLVGRCSRWLVSDLAAGAVLAEAVVRLSDYNVRINAGQYEDAAAAGDIVEQSARDVTRARELAGEIHSVAVAAMS